MSRALHILGLEPFDGGSHRAVRKSITRHSRHRWTWLTRPARGWKWRVRLAAVELVEQVRRKGGLEPPVDAVLATSLLSAADLRALLPAPLRDRPLILYMHENQAAYPLSDHPKVDPGRDVHFALTNFTGALAADRVLWNSRYNRDSFLEGMHGILRRASAVDLSSDWRRRIEQRSSVIWPPVEPPPAGLDRSRAADGVLHNGVRVVWPHRWEHDKGPDALLRMALELSEPLNLRWTVLGWRFPKVPPALEEFRRRLAPRIDHFGHEPDRLRYWAHLARADWVLSTARHEFFGVAVVEALLAGCLPWLPARLSYPELLPEEARGLSPQNPPASRAELVQRITAHLAPAVAPRAVAALDDALSEVAAEGPG